MWNEQKYKIYSPDDLDRLADVRYEERDGGFSCSSCEYLIYGQYCRHRDVRAHVEPGGCCINWQGQSLFKPNKR